MAVLRIQDFSQLHILYCCQVASLGDWHHQYFCEQALVDQKDAVYEIWGESDDVWGEAANLDVEEIQGLQQHLAEFGSESMWEIRQVFFTLVSLSM